MCACARVRVCTRCAEPGCAICKSRVALQKKYLSSIEQLYAEDFHVVRLPLLTEEVRGVARLRRFSQLLVQEEQANSLFRLSDSDADAS